LRQPQILGSAGHAAAGGDDLDHFEVSDLQPPPDAIPVRHASAMQIVYIGFDIIQLPR
jgi:hypothetical protein